MRLQSIEFLKILSYRFFLGGKEEEKEEEEEGEAEGEAEDEENKAGYTAIQSRTVGQ